MLVDSHAHLYWHSYKAHLDQVLKRAHNSGVTYIINIGVDLATSKQAMLQTHPNIKIFSTIGIHPHEAANYFTHSDVSIHKDINHLEKLHQNNTRKIVAIGECGLDYHFEDNPGFKPVSLSSTQLKGLQMELFRAQIDLAKKLNLPLVIHCRDAWNDIFTPLSSVAGVFHCFSGSLDIAQKAVNLGFYISFAANITYPKSDNLKMVAKQVPLGKILIETDSPFLSPQSQRGQRNEPANVAEVAKTLAEIKNLSVKQVSKLTSENAIELFSLKSSS